MCDHRHNEQKHRSYLKIIGPVGEDYEEGGRPQAQWEVENDAGQRCYMTAAEIVQRYREGQERRTGHDTEAIPTMCDHRHNEQKHRSYLKMKTPIIIGPVDEDYEEGGRPQAQYEVENDDGQRCYMTAAEIRRMYNTTIKDDSSLDVLKSLAHELEHLKDEGAAGAASDDNFWVAGGISGDIWARVVSLTGDHEHDHHHEHEHEHHHDHIHNKQTALGFIQEPSYESFTTILPKIDSPMDFYQSEPEFRDACWRLGIVLFWGRAARHAYAHAYVIPFGEGDGEVFTVVTDEDLDKHERGVYMWASHDLFEGEFK